ncbi:MAG: TetR/AcrR family transcriptional regulator [Oscillospiraceae bacterium]|nr:TetR/AcrR family transcriptional regulator [Oscillospiraceae bacterium]
MNEVRKCLTGKKEAPIINSNDIRKRKGTLILKKNPEKAEAKKSEITAAALTLFFEKGYEGTSIRMIQQKLGRKVAGFYYYFASKDEVFEAAIDLFFASYEQEMRAIAEDTEGPSGGKLIRYLDYVDRAAQSFRTQYLHVLHWSILGAIREHTLLIMRKYIGEILRRYLAQGLIAEPEMGVAAVANLLAFGIGGSILYQSGEQYEGQRAQLLQMIPLLLGGYTDR